MDDARKYIVKTLNSMTPESARAAIANGTITVGPIDSPNYKFAFSLIEAKEAKERAAFDSESLTISRKALEISEKAFSIARCANKIAISAIILSIAIAIGIAIFQWLIKK